MQKVLIVGTGGLARELTSYVKDSFDIVGYSSRDAQEHERFGLPGRLFTDEVDPAIVGTDAVFLAIGAPKLKRILAEKYSALGFRFETFLHPSSVVSNKTVVGEGVIVAPNCSISPDVKLGRLTCVNFCCGIGHDAEIGDFTQVNPGSQIGGNARIGSDALIGSGAVILPGVKIGQGAVVGSGSVVFSRVAEGVTVMGNPAKRLRAFEE